MAGNPSYIALQHRTLFRVDLKEPSMTNIFKPSATILDRLTGAVSVLSAVLIMATLAVVV